MHPPPQDTPIGKERTRLRRLSRPASKVMASYASLRPQRPAWVGLEVLSRSYVALAPPLTKLYIARRKLLASSLMFITAKNSHQRCKCT